MSKHTCATLILLTTMLSTTGCRDWGRGGTGEVVVPREQLRDIRAVEPAEEFQVESPRRPATTLPSTRATTGPVREIPLTLAEVRQLSLTNNLDLRVELISPSIAYEALNEEEARFEALFTTDVGYNTTDSPSANTVSQQLSGQQSENLTVTPGVRQPLRTGGVLQLNAPINRFETDSPSAILNPAYSSDLAPSFSQPLLRGGGIYVNTQGIRVAFYAYQQAQARTKLEVIRVLANADRVYWRFFAAREALRVRRQEYELARVQLERARRLVDAGQVAEVEVVRAQSGVADRVEAIINAENLVRDSQRELKRILNSPDLRLGEPADEIVPATPPQPAYLELDVPHLVALARSQRMELLELELQIARDTSEVRVARHETLPLVNFDYTYNINGLGGSLDDSFDMVGNSDFVDHRFGLRLEIPIGNQAARSRLRRALLTRLRSLATREQRELLIQQEVLNAADQLEANWQRILAARQRVALSRRLLDVEIRQFEQGLRTSTEVLEAQANLASAVLSEISATADFQIAQVDIAFATGTVLGATRVQWEPTGVPGK